MVDGQDYMLEPASLSCDLRPEGGVRRAMVSAFTTAVLVTNSTDQPRTIPRHTKLGRVTDYEAEGCYFAAPEQAPLANGPVLFVKKAVVAAFTAAALLNPVLTPP